jgi:hypothetical protein
MSVFVNGLYSNSHLGQGHSLLNLTVVSNRYTIFAPNDIFNLILNLASSLHIHLKSFCHFGKKIIYNTRCKDLSLWGSPGEQVFERRKGNVIKNSHK